MARMWVVVGDATSSGGRVVSGSPFTDVDGKAVARVDDQATCPTHKGVFPIVDGDATIIIDGQPVALHGSSLACGCKVLAVQQVRVFVDAASKGGRGAASPVATASVVSVAARADAAASYDEQIEFAGPGGGLLAGIGYVLHLDDGSVVEGVSDDQGRTRRVATQAPVSIVRAELLAPEHNGGCCAAQALPSQRVSVEMQGVGTHATDIGTSVRRISVPAEDRNLTPGEIAMLRPMFGNAVDYSVVRLHNHGYWLLFGFQPADTATAPNGEIYLPADLFAADFSVVRTRRQRLLVHEMTHVWQYQLGYPVKGVRAPRPNMSYEYTLDANKMFCHYNMEAQGNLLADYFLLAFRNDPEALYERKYRSAANALPLYERALSDFLRDPAHRGNLPKVIL